MTNRKPRNRFTRNRNTSNNSNNKDGNMNLNIGFVPSISVGNERSAHASDADYHKFEKIIKERVAAIRGPLFRADVRNDVLWDLFINKISIRYRQHYTCNCCKNFITTYGAILVENEYGQLVSPLWSTRGIPKTFKNSVAALSKYVNEARVGGSFFTSAKYWGSPSSGGWSHLSGIYAEPFKETTLLDTQKQAATDEEYKMLERAIREISVRDVEHALAFLKSNRIHNGHLALGHCEWFLGLLKKEVNDDRALWPEVAKAPTGWCHVKTSILGSLIADIHAGYTETQIRNKWLERTEGTNYRRPKAEPKLGAIERANKLVQKLGIKSSFDRSFANLGDVKVKLWVPKYEKVVKNAAYGIFGDLFNPVELRQGFPPTGVSSVPEKITWSRFRAEVMPKANTIEYKTEINAPFYGLVTATNYFSKNILKWDNPVSWFFYNGGSHPSVWRLPSPGNWVPVTAIFLAPPWWQNETAIVQGIAKTAMFALAGAKTTDKVPLSIFPQILRDEFHEIRSVVEAYSNTYEVKDGWVVNANGVAFQDNGLQSHPLTLRVDGGRIYIIDRWY